MLPGNFTGLIADASFDDNRDCVEGFGETGVGEGL
jgi:hypothetical protein